MGLSSHSWRRWQLILLLCAFALHIYRLDAQSLWYDEGVSATVAQLDLAQLTRWTANDIQPPLYYYLLAGWGRLAGWSEWSLRFPSAYFAWLCAPLLAALAHKITLSKLAAGIALVITACHPLLVYYGQEARMYALLVALGVLTGYSLLSALQSPGNWRAWLGYILCATLAIYTHYFAFFLLFALALVTLTRPYGAGSGRTACYLLANLSVFGLYLPWLWFMFMRLANDSSYWQGQFKWWEALRRIAITFALGETVLEERALPWLIGVGVITLGAIGRLGFNWRNPAARRLLIVSLCWLVIPILATVILALFTPKFNARYVMLALPGLILLWSGGLGIDVSATKPSGKATAPSRKEHLHPLILSPRHLVILPLLLPFGLGVVNWFTDPAFTKDQWRELAGYVRSQIQPGERVILVSGHAWPIWHYYAADLLPVRLPAIEILDVDSVLDYSTVAAELARQLPNQTGAWLINWQAEVVDPTGVTALALGLGGAEQPVDAQFWKLKVRHYQQLRPNVFQAPLPPHTPVAINFGNRFLLTGYSLLPNADLLLLWQPLAGATPIDDTTNGDPDFWLSGELLTEQLIPLHRLQDRRPAAYQFPTFRWQPGRPVIERLSAQEWSGGGILSGTYSLELGLYDPTGDRAGLDVLDQRGVALGKRARIELTSPHTIADPLPTGAETWPTLSPTLHLTATLSPSTAEPNDRLLLYLEWYVSEALTEPMQLQQSWQPTSDTGQPTSASPLLQIDSALAPYGRYRMAWQISAPNLAPGVVTYELTVRPPTSATLAPFRLPITLLPSTRGFTLPATLAVPLSLVLAPAEEYAIRPAVGSIHLRGLLTPMPASLTAGSSLSLTVVWQASVDWAYPAIDYFATLQLLGADGKPIVQADQSLPRRTSTWTPNEVETQSLSLIVPAEPGDYPVLLAVYAPQEPGMPRLVTPTGADSVILGTLRVTK